MISAVAGMLSGLPSTTEPSLVLYVNDMRLSTSTPGTYLAAGCMRPENSDGFMPLSLRAVYDAATNSYDAVVYSTVVPPGTEEPFVIRLSGKIMVRGDSVKDNSADGTFKTEFGIGSSSRRFHDRRVTKCPTMGSSGFEGDLYTHRDLGFPTPRTWTLYEGWTVVVSSGMLVEAPDGSSIVVQEYTDIFSPDADFVGRFRYLTQFEGQPLVGGVYRFALPGCLRRPHFGRRLD